MSLEQLRKRKRKFYVEDDVFLHFYIFDGTNFNNFLLYLFLSFFYWIVYLIIL